MEFRQGSGWIQRAVAQHIQAHQRAKAGIGKGQLILIADHNAGLIGGERHPLCAWPDCPRPAKIEHICKRPRHHRRAFAQFFGHQIMQEGYAAKT